MPMHISDKIATAVEISGNEKIGQVSCTSVAQVSCPLDCIFFNAGCYAESGLQAFTTHRLNRAADSSHATALQAARHEAAAIDTLSGKRPLRLHVVGDCRNNTAARIVSKAAARHRAKQGQPVWTYSHAWRKVARASWKDVSVLASCDSMHDIATARQAGYATALVVASFDSDKRYSLPNGESILPCPQQTGRAADCKSCKLCMRDDYLRDERLTIGFVAHGPKAATVKAALIQIGARA